MLVFASGPNLLIIFQRRFGSSASHTIVAQVERKLLSVASARSSFRLREFRSEGSFEVSSARSSFRLREFWSEGSVEVSGNWLDGH